jgi:sugar/nucleoside kinase (ribokinase family)
MIVVVGSPRGRLTEQGVDAGGVAATIARVAADGGAEVQLVGKVGEGATGDAVLLALVRARVGHVAVLRDASHETPIVDATSDADEVLEPDDGASQVAGAAAEPAAEPAEGPTLDAADLELALRYLPDYRVVVVADTLEPAALATVAAAARWSGAQLVVVLASGSSGADLPDDATILQSPPIDPDGAFATVVGAYAAALDRGSTPAEAFTSASVGSGWSAVVD